MDRSSGKQGPGGDLLEHERDSAGGDAPAPVLAGDPVPDRVGALLLEDVDRSHERVVGDDDPWRDARGGGVAEDLLPASVEARKIPRLRPGKLVRDRVALELEEAGKVAGKRAAEVDDGRYC